MKTITKNLFALILIAIFAVACGGGGSNGSLSGQLSGREFSISTTDLRDMVTRCFSRGSPGAGESPSSPVGALEETSFDSSSTADKTEPSNEAPPPSSGGSSPSPSIKVSFTSNQFTVKSGSQILLEGTWVQLSDNTIKISAQGTEAVITVQVRGDSLSLGLANDPVNAACSSSGPTPGSTVPPSRPADGGIGTPKPSTPAEKMGE